MAARAPRWATFFSEVEWQAFTAAVEAELAKRRVPYQLKDGYLWAPWGGGVEEALSLLTLAQLCRAGGIERWPHIISHHLEALIDGRKDRTLAEDLGSDLARARPLLRPRLYAAETFAGQEADFVVRPIADDLVAVLCFDLPANVVTVSAAAAASWQIDRDELWYVALANLRRHERTEPEAIVVGGVGLHTMVGDSFFVASNLLLLADYLPTPPSPQGVLVVVPNRHTLVFHVLEDSEVDPLRPLVMLATDMHATGPGSVSPHLFWWHDDGAIDTLHTSATGNSYELLPSSEFVTRVLGPRTDRRHMN